MVGLRKFKSAEEFAKCRINAYHGTSAKEFDKFRGDVVYLTRNPQEAKAFATNPIIGGGRGAGKPRVLGVFMPEGKIKNINGLILDTIMNDDDLDAVIAEQTKIARKDGFEYLSFQHPSSITGGKDFDVLVAVNPHKLLIKQQLI